MKWSVEPMSGVAHVNIGHYHQYFKISGPQVAPCNFWGDLEPHSSVAAHRLPDEVEEQVRKCLKEKL